MSINFSNVRIIQIYEMFTVCVQITKQTSIIVYEVNFQNIELCYLFGYLKENNVFELK